MARGLFLSQASCSLLAPILASKAQGGRDNWQIFSADGGITVLGTDARVYVRNMNTGRNIQDNNGNVRMSSNTGGWEKFKASDLSEWVVKHMENMMKT